MSDPDFVTLAEQAMERHNPHDGGIGVTIARLAYLAGMEAAAKVADERWLARDNIEVAKAIRAQAAKFA